MDWNDVLNNLQQSVITIVVALIGLAATYAVTYIKKLKDKVIGETNKIEDEATKSLATTAINRIGDLAVATVSALEQEYGKAIRDSIANGDGEFTRDDLIALHDKAIQQVKDQLTDEAISAAESQINDIEGYISTKVSEALLNIKNNQSATLSSCNKEISSED